jgi:hypothetical protein
MEHNQEPIINEQRESCNVLSLLATVLHAMSHLMLPAWANGGSEGAAETGGNPKALQTKKRVEETRQYFASQAMRNGERWSAITLAHEVNPPPTSCPVRVGVSYVSLRGI